MAITINKIKDVIEAKERLDNAIGPALSRLSIEAKNHDFTLISGSKETAALRRASMDLTRELANLRRS
jgi:hypothetical protein